MSVVRFWTLRNKETQAILGQGPLHEIEDVLDCLEPQEISLELESVEETLDRLQSQEVPLGIISVEEAVAWLDAQDPVELMDEVPLIVIVKPLRPVIKSFEPLKALKSLVGVN